MSEVHGRGRSPDQGPGLLHSPATDTAQLLCLPAWGLFSTPSPPLLTSVGCGLVWERLLVSLVSRPFQWPGLPWEASPAEEAPQAAHLTGVSRVLSAALEDLGTHHIP